MELFEWVLILLVGAVGLTALARKMKVPYPSLLALGGTALALLPTAPEFRLDPELTLALFVAPVLLDAAYDTSLRDLKANWVPVTSLVLAAVGITTAAVAWVAHTLVPTMPWAAAIALGAIVAPPDAAAATAVLRSLRLPHRVLVVLEGESLLNDASALLIYRFAVLAVVSGGLDPSRIIPMSLLAITGSLVVGYVLARLYMRLTRPIEDAPSAIVMQFAGTFGVWILAENLGLSAIVTVVVYAVTVARDAPAWVPARQRVPSYAVWETVVFILNVLAFVLIGLQLRPILGGLEPAERIDYIQVAAAVLVTVILARFAWILLYFIVARIKARFFGKGPRLPGDTPNVRRGVLVGWCGMRGIVTLAAAYALPIATSDSPAFPFRDLILLCAFCVVVGTLVLQGLTLRPLVLSLKLQDDGPVDREVRLARERMAHIGLAVLEADRSPAAHALRKELQHLLDARNTSQPSADQSRFSELRGAVVAEQRRALLDLRANGEIGDDAFHRIEAELDIAELNAETLSRPG
jgi:Na+/H+ antiporter